jgi:hypothetical protein
MPSSEENDEMNAKRIITVLLAAFVALSVVWLIVREAVPRHSKTDIVAPVNARQVVVYYFHRTARCPTCLKIESLAKTEVESSFASELKTGDLKFQSLNVEDGGNEHFVRDYNLVSQSLVLVDYRNGVQQQWKNLDAVWDLVHSENDFASYVRNEVRAFIGAS